MSMRAAPLIALLSGRSPDDRYSLHRGYVDAVSRAGGIPVVIPAGPGLDPAAVATSALRCAAVVLTGGGDVDPSCYGAEAGDRLMDVDAARDAGEIAVVHAALEAGTRLLGVCRGIQVLAVATGGSLISDVGQAGYHSHWDEDRQYEPVHGMKSESGSLAERVLCGETSVNSIHHQAIGDPGPYLRPTAWAPDGLIEAVEAAGVLGVQWHPERLVATNASHLGAFDWIVHG